MVIISYKITFNKLYVLYNRNIWRREILANRLNFPIREKLNWQNGMVGSHDFMGTMSGRARETRPRTEVENFTFLVM